MKADFTEVISNVVSTRDGLCAQDWRGHHHGLAICCVASPLFSRVLTRSTDSLLNGRNPDAGNF